MKILFTLAISTILIVGSSCKKTHHGTSSQPPVPTEKKFIVSTLAGQGAPTFINGPLLTATFHFPEDVAVGPDGTIYVTDILNFCIRKITGNQVSTFAGGDFGFLNANGETAKFRNPFSLTIDAAGNLYTTDGNDPRIRKINPDRDVTTYAGLDQAGFADGDADTARFGFGNSITADAEGNIYVSDAANNRIRKVSTTGKVTTIAGTGTFGFRDGDANQAQFAIPGGIARDNQGNLYVVDRGNFVIRKITPAGVVSTFVGTGTNGEKDGNPGEAQISDEVHDIVADTQGNLYLEDGHRVRKITPLGVVSTIAGKPGLGGGYVDGDGAVAEFDFLAGIGIDALGNLYLADLRNNRIRRIRFE